VADPISAALLSVALDRDERQTLVHQLYARLRDIILGRPELAGLRLPSTRMLSRDMGVSRTVTLTAYEQLAVEGYVTSRPGSGYFVEQLAELRTTPPTARTTTSLVPEPPTSRGHPFDPLGQPDDIFPHQTWARLLARSWRAQHKAAASSSPLGLLSLRVALAAHLHALKGIAYDPCEILITSGNRDALQLIARTFTPREEGCRAWVEDPCHIGAVQTLRSEGLTIVPVPVDEEGANIGYGIARAPDARLALLTPARQFPLGMPLSLPRRVELLNWASQAGAIVVEDEYDSEIRFAGRPIASLAAMNPQGSILSLGSFSKLTFPGLRLGYVAGPRHLIAQLSNSRSSIGLELSTPAQAALAAFMDEGAFGKHLRNVRARLINRRKVLLDLLHKELPRHLVILNQEVGMHVTVLIGGPLDKRCSDVDIAAEALRHRLYLSPLSAQSIEAPRRSGFLLGYGGWTEEEIARGVEILAGIIARHAPD
jgi:GntR family transcriptional regulator/MocR family aminotransferase